jgi:hypothetical protein
MWVRLFFAICALAWAASPSKVDAEIDFFRQALSYLFLGEPSGSANGWRLEIESRDNCVVSIVSDERKIKHSYYVKNFNFETIKIVPDSAQPSSGHALVIEGDTIIHQELSGMAVRPKTATKIQLGIAGDLGRTQNILSIIARKYCRPQRAGPMMTSITGFSSP